MELPGTRVTWLLYAIAVAIGVFLLGVALGKQYEQAFFEMDKTSAIADAESFLAHGDIDKAIARLHFAKAFEPRVGWTDAELGKAYLAKGQPCLAQDFLASGIDWMTREKLRDLSMFATAKDSYRKATEQCSMMRERLRPK